MCDAPTPAVGDKAEDSESADASGSGWTAHPTDKSSEKDRTTRLRISDNAELRQKITGNNGARLNTRKGLQEQPSPKTRNLRHRCGIGCKLKPIGKHQIYAR